MFIWRLPKDKYQHAFYRNELQKHGIIQSMSRKGNCYDNCIMETFFGRLKNEMFYGFEKDYPSFEVFSKTSLDKGTQRKTTENELPSLTQCTA